MDLHAFLSLSKYSHRFLTKTPKTDIAKMTASFIRGAGKTGYPHVED
jgi:hypothetical protein